MAAQNSTTDKDKILNEILDYATGLPLESQYQLLVTAKAMEFTNKKLIGEKAESKRQDGGNMIT